MNRTRRWSRGVAAGGLLLASLLAAGACGGAETEGTPTPTKEAATRTPTLGADGGGKTATAAPTATSKTAGAATTTVTAAGTGTPGATASPGGSATPGRTATSTQAPQPTATPTPQPTLAPGEIELIVSDGAGKAVRVRAEVADTPGERTQGLMGRTSLAEDAGMLFVFDGMAQGPFWMKNTYVPLDIAFLALDGTVNEILEGVPESEALLQPAAPYLYVLEVNEGWFARHGLGVGARVEFPGS